MAVTTTAKKSTVSTEGTSIFINFAAGKTDAEITTLIPNTTEIGGYTTTREVKSKTTTTGVEMNAVGTLKYGDREVKFLLGDDNRAIYTQLRAAMNDKDKCTISAKFIEAGYGDITFGDHIITEVNTPNAGGEGEMVEVTLKLKPAGAIQATFK
ncbi:hypothetical protein CK627_20950 [Aeromonas dhakensis]|uniref:hypothetical protein n=1 Tax=Aeromonas dhakensis TaxID=196024 RepID=UPI000BAB0151|nr:hypothetical protein [Aeromonas dhakensis]ASX13078.1 hypothetical protein CK627_20950 [Aeromonas dhakensis]